MLSTQTDCFGLVWEHPVHIDEAVRRTVRFERGGTAIPNIPVEISSDSTLEISSSFVNPVCDPVVVLRALANAAKKYRSVVVFHKGVPAVRWLNTCKNTYEIDLVIDSRDVSNFILLQRSFEFNRWVTLINFAAFVCVTLMFVHVAAI
jgi:hypothetical protein